MSTVQFVWIVSKLEFNAQDFVTFMQKLNTEWETKNKTLHSLIQHYYDSNELHTRRKHMHRHPIHSSNPNQ